MVYEQPNLGLPVLQSRVTVWFPTSRWATTGWSNVRYDWADRFCPQRWWQLLSLQPGPIDQLSGGSITPTQADVFPDFEYQSTIPVAGRGWWKLDFEEPEGDVCIWSIEQAWAGTITLSLFLIGCMCLSLACSQYWQRWLFAWAVTGTALALVPASWLMLVQLLALSLCASTIVRLARTTARQSRAQVNRRHDSRITKSLVPKSASVSVWLLMAWLSCMPVAVAQPFKEGLKPKREVFGILIPVNQRNEVTVRSLTFPRAYTVCSRTPPKAMPISAKSASPARSTR